MKFKEFVSYTCTNEQLFSLFDSPEKLTSWNPVITSFRGSFELESEIEFTVVNFASSAKQVKGKITGYVKGKYLSFSYSTGPGTWWYEVEHIFRIAKDKTGKSEFVNEIYANGLRLRFGKLKLKSTFKQTLYKMNTLLEEKCSEF